MKDHASLAKVNCHARNGWNHHHFKSDRQVGRGQGRTAAAFRRRVGIATWVGLSRSHGPDAAGLDCARTEALFARLSLCYGHATTQRIRYHFIEIGSTLQAVLGCLRGPWVEPNATPV